MLRSLLLSACLVGGGCVGGFLVRSAEADAQRATDEQLDKETLPLDEYLKDIRKNYPAIEALILKRGKADAGQLARRFEAERNKTADGVDKAVYSYLLARTWFWSGFNQFKATLDKGVFASLRPKMLQEYLSAFDLTQKFDNPTGPALALRKQVIDTFIVALGTDIWGASLTPEQKTRAVNEFVVILEASPDGKALLAANEATPLMYKNLGRPFDVETVVPRVLPDDYDKLLKILEKYRRDLPPQAFLPVLETLEKKYTPRLEKAPEIVEKIADIYESAGRVKDTVRLLTQLADKRPSCNLSLYLLSLRNGNELHEDNPRQFLDRYLSAAKPVDTPLENRQYSIEQAYESAVDSLMKAKLYKECQYAIERFEGDKSGPFSFVTTTRLAYSKALCLEETGEKAKALAEYKRLLQAIEGKPGVEIVKRNCERHLKKLTEENP